MMVNGREQSMRRALDLLARIEKQVLDRQHLTLRAIEAEIERNRRELSLLEGALASELSIAWALPGGPRPFAAYNARARERQHRLMIGIEALGHSWQKAEASLHEAMQRFKGLDLAAERMRARATELLRRQAEAACQEIVLLRAACLTEPREEAAA